MRRTCSIIAVVVLTVLAGCTKPEPARVRYVNFKVYDPVYVALDMGLYGKRGLKVEMIGDVLAGPTAIQAVASGSAEGGLSSFPAIINARAAGLPIVGVSDIQSAIGPQALEEFYVRADSGIKTVADLKGKKVAVNLWKSSFHYTVLMALEQAGVKEEEVEFVLLPFDQQAAALERKQVDVIGLMEPYASAAKATYGNAFAPVFTALDVFGAKQFTTHFLNSLWAKEHPKEAEAFVGATVEAIAWIEDHPEEAKPIIARYTGVDVKYIPAYHFQPNGRVNMEDATFWLSYLRKRGDVKADWLKVEDFATNAYNVKEK